jgi:hypothetical protein
MVVTPSPIPVILQEKKCATVPLSGILPLQMRPKLQSCLQLPNVLPKSSTRVLPRSTPQTGKQKRSSQCRRRKFQVMVPLKMITTLRRPPTDKSYAKENGRYVFAYSLAYHSKSLILYSSCILVPFEMVCFQIEEEDYTSRVIQYFSTGLLALPDGATLRSYLAEKLNCDPMRITKKFTGACCLGRRAYHLRDRPRASPAEMDAARLELQHLEQRFHLRVEHEQSGLPLPPRHELLAAQPPSAPSNMSSIPSLLASLHGGTPMPNPWVPTSAPPPAMSPNSAVFLPGANPYVAGNLLNLSALANPTFPLAATQLLLQASNERYDLWVCSCDLLFCCHVFGLIM